MCAYCMSVFTKEKDKNKEEEEEEEEEEERMYLKTYTGYNKVPCIHQNIYKWMRQFDSHTFRLHMD